MAEKKLSHSALFLSVFFLFFQNFADAGAHNRENVKLFTLFSTNLVDTNDSVINFGISIV